MVRYTLLSVLFASLVIPAALNQREVGDAEVFCGTPSHASSAGSRFSIADQGSAGGGDAVLTTNTNIFARFELWANGYVADLPAARRPSEEEGVVLARKRRVALEQLIESDPQSALAAALSIDLRRQLPPAIAALLEEQISDYGDFEVLAQLPRGEPGPSFQPIERYTVFGEKRYRAFVYSRRVRQMTTRRIPLHGIAINDKMAVHESPIRRLEEGEVAALQADAVDQTCPTSGRQGDTSAAALIAGKAYLFCGSQHLAATEQELMAADAFAPNSSWTQGNKTLLYMRLNFPDDPTMPETESYTRQKMELVNDFFLENSYGQLSIAVTIPPVLTLPQPKTYYQTSASGVDVILTDARRAARQAGYDIDLYDLDCIRFVQTFGLGGRGYVGAKGSWLESSDVGTARHELGHNFGVWHANAWQAANDTIIGPGQNVEYGNRWDTMGQGAYDDSAHFNACFKSILRWLPGSHTPIVSTSGLYRLHACDTNSLRPGVAYALQIPKGDGRTYWLEKRQQFSYPGLRDGVLVNWSPWSFSNGGTHLLDMIPDNTAYPDGEALVIGRTFADRERDVFITPVSTGHDPANWIDVAINFGPFHDNKPQELAISATASNTAPFQPITFSASATDPDGDPLAYYWSFGDQQIGTHGAVVSKSWPDQNDYVVRCTVTDMKGGTATRILVVRVGNPAAQYRISGRVTRAGNPIEGVRIHFQESDIYPFQDIFTDSDGFYALAGLSSGSYSLAAVKPGYQFEPSGFSNPFSLDSDFIGADFRAVLVANRAPVALGYGGPPHELWRAYYSNAACAQVTSDSEGNIYVATANMGAIKYSPDGKFISSRQLTWGNTAGMAVSSSNDIFIAGAVNLVGDINMVTSKIPPGTGYWEREYASAGGGPDEPVAVAVDRFNAVYVAGAASTNAAREFVTVKYDNDGAQQWVARYNPPGAALSSPRALALDRSGRPCVAGFARFDDDEVTTVCYGIDGVLGWARSFDSTDPERAVALAIDPAGNVFVTGWASNALTGADFLTLKYDAAGNLLWNRRYNSGGNAHDVPVAIFLDSATNVCVAGSDSADYLLLKYTPEGEALWAARYPTPDPNVARAAAIDDLGNVYITGTASNSATGLDYFTVSFSPHGTFRWAIRYNHPENRWDNAVSIAIDPFGKVLLTGWSSASFIGLITTFKYDPPAPALVTVTNTPLSITLRGSDPDNDPITFQVLDHPSHGTLSGSPPAMVYTPAAGYVGPDNFTFQTSDPEQRTSVPGTVHINVLSRPVLSGLTRNGVTWQMTGRQPPGYTTLLERSDDLEHWQTIKVMHNAPPSLTLTDTNRPPQQFYRLGLDP